MRNRSSVWLALLAFSLISAGASAAWAGAKSSKESSSSASAAAASSTQDENLHLEGEKRFRSNCARCHAAPPRFAPRMMSTIVRHMRVRATITDEDMRLILRYMTE
jgi:mono/diheme cytochrome c family protein